MRHTFAVGRLTPKATEIRLLEPRPAPLPGPWNLQVVVRAPRERGRRRRTVDPLH